LRNGIADCGFEKNRSKAVRANPWLQSSIRLYRQNAIKPKDKASKAVLALDLVTFHYKKEINPKATAQFGLVAEEVENVNPDLIARDKGGKSTACVTKQ
jgi:hypothetical protein